MQRRFWMWPLAALVMALLMAGCEDLDQTVEEFNRRATQIAGGVVDEPGQGGEQPSDGQLPPGEAPAPGEPVEQPVNTFDLPTTGGTLANAWGQTYALPAGSEFVIIASERQVSDYVVERLRASGWQDSVYGGSAAISGGQVRIDLALENEAGDFGGGTVSFQPTLDAASQLRLNPQGGEFGGLRMPNNFIPAVGDAVYAALAGAPNANLSSVTLSDLSLDSGTMRVSGTVR